VRRILELHRGQIRATSGGLGRGSEFVATLPVLALHAGDTATPQSRPRLPAPLVTPRPRKVLIVDDHEEVGKSVASLVREWGHEAVIAREGPSALSIADTFQPDCAIIDISLPGMNGIDLARHLRQVFPPAKLYLIALTGYADADVRDACLAAGFDVHLVKPGEIDLLERLLAGT
jgi:CheY-like chemotaxis protein